MKNKSVLITGAANGIGACLAEEFSKAGSTLLLWDRDGEALSKLQAYLTDRYKNNVYTFVFDITDRLKRRVAINDILYYSEHSVDILINNAGIGMNEALLTTPSSQYQKLWDINFQSIVEISLQIIPRLIKTGGQIVNVSSGQAFFKLPTWGAYAATKSALGTWSETLGIELKPYGVDVTTVYPFMVNTGFYEGMEKSAEGWGAEMSMKLLPYYSQKPETVAKIIFKAIKKKKRVEMVHPLNWVGYHLDTIPTLGYLVRKLANFALTKENWKRCL